jgi:hypothetical protein
VLGRNLFEREGHIVEHSQLKKPLDAKACLCQSVLKGW